MTFNEPGIYELTYKAIDECGNETYATRNVTVEAEPPSDIIMTSGASGEIVFSIDRPGYSESPAVFTPPEYSEDPYTIAATIIFEDFVLNGSEPIQRVTNVDVEVEGDYVYIAFHYSGDIIISTSNTTNKIMVRRNQSGNEQSCSWSSVVVRQGVY